MGHCRALLFGSGSACFLAVARVCGTIMPVLLSKGNRVNIPEPARGDWSCFGRIQRGNATELGDAGVGHGKSFLFFVRN